MSSAARRIWRPEVTGRVALTVPPASSASSMRSTASLPAGTIAPVEILTAWPRLEAAAIGSAGARLADHRQRDGSSLRRRGGVGGAHAQNHPSRSCRSRVRRRGSRRPGPARGRGRPQRHLFGRRRSRPAQDQLQRVLRAKQAGRLLRTLQRPRRLRAAASSARSVSRPPTLSGSFAASTAPSSASRGSPGALPVSARRRAGSLASDAWVTGTAAGGRRRAGRAAAGAFARDFGRAAARRCAVARFAPRGAGADSFARVGRLWAGPRRLAGLACLLTMPPLR